MVVGEYLLEFINTLHDKLPMLTGPDPFQAGTNHFQSISAVGEKAVWPCTTTKYVVNAPRP